MKAVIIDDEPDCVRLLGLQLKIYCPQIDVVAECTASEEGMEAIRSKNPDLVFLDIEMPRMNGFQLLEIVGEINFAVIFITAYDKFAIKAFKFSAIDYLLKPTDASDLQRAVQKAESSFKVQSAQINLLRQHLYNPKINKPFPEKIALPFQNGVVFAELKNVLYCQANDNYTYFFLAGSQKHLVSKTLRNIQDILEERNFLRVSRTHLVNLDHIVRFVKGEGCYLVMSDGATIPVAKSQKEKLVERFGWI